jgi:signal transduction histidine kinase
MVVKVSDTGSGIKPEHLGEIFTPFFTTKDKGVGLGLALSYQIVQEHLGTIRVESKAGEGTTFSVYLPLAV